MRSVGRARASCWLLVAVVVGGVVGVRIAAAYEPYTFLLGDCPYYAQTAISLAMDGDLDLRNQLKGGLEAHNRQISLGARGEWYPKHPILMPLATLPLLPILRMNAFLVFNAMVLIGLALVLFELSRLAAGDAGAVAGALATILGSYLILYDYNYSPNLFATLLLALGVLALFQGRTGTAGVVAGLASFASTSNVFLLPLLLCHAAWKRKARGALLFAAGAALPLAVQLALNTAMFGSALTSPYTRILSIESGEIVLRSHVADFDNPIWDGIRGQLLDPEKGLLYTAPVLLVAVPGFVIWFRRRRDEALLCFVLGEFLFLLFSRYRWWPTSHQGNRFLMPLVALSAPAVACAASWAIARLRSRMPSRLPSPDRISRSSAR